VHRRPVLFAVSAPIAVYAAGGHFNDDEDSIFEEHINWMADAKVTLGCNPPVNDHYCPDDNVTRGEMAAFMRRLAQYLGAEDGTPAEADHAVAADDADTVDSYHANELTRMAYDIDESGNPITVSGIIDIETLLTVAVTAPVDGWVTVSGMTNLTGNATVGASICEISVEDIDGNPGADILDGSQAINSVVENDQRTCAPVAGFLAEAETTYTINLDVAVFLANVSVDQGTLVAEFQPFGGGGLPPLTIILPGIITLGETADSLAATIPEIGAQLPEIKAAISNL
jgi:hypothetical protein